MSFLLATSASSDGGYGRAVDMVGVEGAGRHTIPVNFPNCHYSFTNPPPFIGDPKGPTFSLKKPESASAYTYFSLLFDDLLTLMANQTNLYARLHPFIRLTINGLSLMLMSSGQF